MEGFQDVLKQAADIKAAQLRERPGRQDWERAPEWFKYTAYADKEVAAARLGPLDARLELCQGYKDEGNERYEAEDVPGALQLYTRALSLFVWFDRGADKAKEDIPYVNSVLRMAEGQDKAQINALVTILFNNAASCLIRLEQHDGAIYAASKALEHDPYNVKALYRRAAAQRAGGTSAGMEAAVRDLQQAQTLEPGNIQVRSALALYQKELLEQNRKDAALYGNMFARGQLYEDKAATQGAGEAQLEEIGRDKSKDPSPHEVARALRGMQAGMQQAQGRPPPATWGDALLPFSFLPWWAWMLIVLHLLYRIAKLWRVPMPWATPTRVLEPHESGWQEEL